MAGNVYSYDASQVLVTLGPHSIEGWGDDEFVSIERQSPRFEDKVGSDGDVTRFDTHDDRATVKITVMQSSDANSKLNLLYQADKIPGGAGIVPFLCLDKNSQLSAALWAGEKAWISEAPVVAFLRGVEARVWTVRIAHLADNHAGY